MNNPDLKNIISKIRKKDVSPIYLLEGEEPYYIDLICQSIEENILNEEEKAFNQTILYGKDVDPPQLIAAAKSFPMMADHQVIIVKEAQDIKNYEPFISYIEQPQPSTVLVFCYKYKKFDKRKAAYKAISKNGLVFESKKLYDNQVPDWIIKYAKKNGHPISAKASLLLSEYLGNDLSKISNELGKLFLNIGEGLEIDTEIIEKNIGISKDFNNFELQHAIANKDAIKSYQIVRYFGANPKNHPIFPTIITLYNFFVGVMTYHFTKDKSSKGIASALKINPYFVKNYEIAARNYPTKKISKIITALKDTDLKAKGVNNTSATHAELMQELIFKILH